MGDEILTQLKNFGHSSVESQAEKMQIETQIYTEINMVWLIIRKSEHICGSKGRSQWRKKDWKSKPEGIRG